MIIIALYTNIKHLGDVLHLMCHQAQVEPRMQGR